VKVPYSKEVAFHVVPESCVLHREVQGEALTGVRIGQPLSRDSLLILGAHAVDTAQGNMTERVIASALLMSMTTGRDGIPARLDQVA
jgi:hypothetical protein